MQMKIANKKSNKESNFSPKEWTELRNLINQIKPNQPNIVIKEVDNGGGAVTGGAVTLSYFLTKTILVQ